MKKYAKNLKEAKEIFKDKTGFNFGVNDQNNATGITIYKLKIKRTPKRSYFVGTYLEWLNL